jgi:hypothetical protein
MAVDPALIGYALPAFDVVASAERIAQFARAIGMSTDGTSAPSVAPPTFMKAVEGENNSSRRILDALGVDLKRVLHAEQQFDYLAPIRAGDALRVQRTVTEIYERKNGQMEFIVIQSSVTRVADGELAGRSRQIVLVRHPAPKGAA